MPQARAFEDRVVVVTGGTGALGRGVVQSLVDGGARVIVPNVDARLLETFDLASHPQVQVIDGADLLDEPRVDALYDGLQPIWASVHLVGGFKMAPIAATTAADMERMWRLNALSCFLATRAAIRSMRRGPGGGRIVNVAARPALTPTAGMVAYATSKAAVVSLTQSVAEEVRAEGIWVNAIAPSIMDTPDNRRAMPRADHDKWPKVDDVARAIVFLASPHNVLTTGLVMPVYGHG